jgi:2-keto-4-pentenoate hydratase/2-oxohepta-3-ene-1,7-dioic acid hydratase in catechol pathway
MQIRKAVSMQPREAPRGNHMNVLRVVVALAALSGPSLGEIVLAQEVTRYVRYADNDSIAYGILDGDQVRELDGAPQVRELDGAPWHGGMPSGAVVPADEVTLLAPAEPSKVIAVGYNYISHREDMTHEESRPIPEHPPLFLKLPTSLTGPNTDIVYPADATDLHYEGELVVVVGKEASKVPVSKAQDYVFGVTAGNDVSERNWQANDLQWLRAKASDTFAPLGPSIVSGLDYLDLQVQTRLNGETMQNQSSRDHIHDVHAILSFVSQYVTLLPGDIIFTGTPGATSAMKPGDVVEIEVEGVGILRNRVVAGK